MSLIYIQRHNTLYTTLVVMTMSVLKVQSWWLDESAQAIDITNCIESANWWIVQRDCVCLCVCVQMWRYCSGSDECLWGALSWDHNVDLLKGLLQQGCRLVLIEPGHFNPVHLTRKRESHWWHTVTHRSTIGEMDGTSQDFSPHQRLRPFQCNHVSCDSTI